MGSSRSKQIQQDFLEAFNALVEDQYRGLGGLPPFRFEAGIVELKNYTVSVLEPEAGYGPFGRVFAPLYLMPKDLEINLRLHEARRSRSSARPEYDYDSTADEMGGELPSPVKQLPEGTE